MILYIPTCSLNMNNILSTDSISPAALYPRRKTGNRRFFPVVACPSDEVIYLYSKIPSYKVSDGGMENYRVVIALDADKIAQPIKKIGSKHNVDVYVCESSIFFTPQNATFLYEGKNAFQTCSIQAEQSLENKTFHLYDHKQIAHDLEFKWDKSYCGKYGSEILSSASIEDDRIDRIKGAIVCYYAGLNQVMSPELATLKKDARKIKNVFSAKVNSPNKELSPEQDSILEPIVKEFYEVFLTVDPVSLRNKETIDLHLSSSKTLRANEGVISRSVVLNIIEELGLMQGLMQRLGLREPFDIYSLYDIIGNSKMADLLPVKMGEMDRAIAAVEMSLSSSSSKSQIKLDDVFHISDKHELVISDKESKLDFYNKFLNALVDGKHLEYADQKPSLAIALLGGQILKSFYDEERWSNSPSRGYVNALLSNIQNGTPFDVLSDQHDILQAFAIFSLKGTDIDKLSDNLSQNGILEYRYAWGLYGATYGYSQLPKTFTACVLKKELLDAVHKLLFPECSKICEAAVPALSEVLNVNGESSAVDEGPLNEKPVSTGEEIEDLPEDTPREIPKTESDPLEELRVKLEAVRYGRRNLSLKNNQIEQILEQFVKSGQRLDESFIARIARIRGIGDESLSAIRDALNIHPVKTAEFLFPDDSYQQDPGLYFVTDKGLTDIVRELRIGDPDVEKTILDQIKRVQEKHMKDSPKDNNKCIKHLNNLLFYENAPKHLKRTPNNEQIVEALIDRLKIRYR